jgi:hypothetical protein
MSQECHHVKQEFGIGRLQDIRRKKIAPREAHVLMMKYDQGFP